MFDQRIVVLALLFSSCSKFTAVDPPQNQITADKVYSTDAGAQTAMNGAYIDMMNNIRGVMNAGISLDAALATDEAWCPPAPLMPAEDTFYLNALKPENGSNNSVFGSLYTLIFEVNSVIDVSGASKGMSAGVKAQVAG